MTRRAFLLYDGDCGLCEASARRLARWDWTGRLTLADLRQADLTAIDPRLTREGCAARLHLVEAGAEGRISAGFYAIRRLSALLPALWWAAPVLHMPGARRILEPAYEALARLRFELSRR